MAIEEPPYKVLVTENSFEIRQYAPMLIAETLVEGDMDEASSKGFRLIADFIFGNNQVSDSQLKSKIAMTAPVTAEPQSSKISMTAPVTLEPSSAAMTMQTTNQWRISFVMPSQYTMDTIPKPKNNAVRLKEIPSRYFAVHTYSGFNNLARVQSKTDETVAWTGKRSLKMIGTPQISRYDPPWTLPMFRRNEIMVEISAP
ncbi:MAG: heme-binding protein [Comamonadaceae bacterium]|nr:MAG: heme-binding protein [Comamonadaceae bacterium]